MKKNIFLGLLVLSSTFSVHARDNFTKVNDFFSGIAGKHKLSGSAECSNIIVKKVVDNRINPPYSGRETFALDLGTDIKDQMLYDLAAKIKVSGNGYHGKFKSIKNVAILVGQSIRTTLELTTSYGELTNLELKQEMGGAFSKQVVVQISCRPREAVLNM